MDPDLGIAVRWLWRVAVVGWRRSCALAGLALLCGVVAGASPPEPEVDAESPPGIETPAAGGPPPPAAVAAAAAVAASGATSLTADGPDGKRLEIPSPPPEIETLIRRGNVAFTLYDPRRDPQEFAGLTRFDLKYRYRATSRWTVRRVGSLRQLQIRPRFDQLELEFRHEVSVPAYVLGDGFFDHPLVRHELDHVRITTDPRLEALFHRWIDQDLTRLNVPLEPAQQPDGQLVRKQVEEAINAVFQRVIDMARIRYDQLDRETAHGQQALPADFFERLQQDGVAPSG